MTPEEVKQKAKELVNKYLSINLSQVNDLVDGIRIRFAKECALISIENEYHEKRELLYLLRVNTAIEPKVYLHFIDFLIEEEQVIKQELLKHNK